MRRLWVSSGRFQRRLDSSDEEPPPKEPEDTMMIEWPGVYNTPNAFRMDATVADVRKRGIDKVDDIECVATRAKRARQFVPERVF